MSDLEKRIKELEQWAGAAEERESALSCMVTELERQMEELCFKGFVPHHVQCNLKILDDRINELEARQPKSLTMQEFNELRLPKVMPASTSAPEPEPESVCGTCRGKGIIYGDRFGTFRRHEPCPDCQPEPVCERCGESLVMHQCRHDLPDKHHESAPEPGPIIQTGTVLTSEQRERGRELVRQCTGLVADYDTLLRIVREMRDWISDLVKEPQ